MTEQNLTRSVIDSVLQIGIVVGDVDAVAENYRRLLGVQDWYLNIVDTAQGIGQKFHCRGRSIDVKAKIAWARIGNVELELIEPMDQDSIYAQFLQDKGPGIHHVMFGGVDLKHCSSHFAAAGISVLAGGELQDTRFELFDTEQALGLICEFAAGGELVPDNELPRHS